MVKNSPLVNSMLTFCKNVNVPEIIRAVEGDQGAAAGPARTNRRWLREMGQHRSMIDPELPVEHDYNFLKAFCTAFETLNPASLAKIYTTEGNDEEERFDGFCLCFRPQILRIVRADIRVFTLDAFFISLTLVWTLETFGIGELFQGSKLGWTEESFLQYDIVVVNL